MNLNPGGKNVPQMRDGWFVKDGMRMTQPMQDTEGKPKGIKRVLEERGLWPEGRKLNLDCTQPCHDGVSTCCARRILASQPDFQEQKSLLEETVLSSGHQIEFYPKFHCECNFIERVWAEAKRDIREMCDYSYSSLVSRVPTVLEGIKVETIQNYFRRAWRYIHAYSLGLQGKMAEWAVRKYKSHRRIPATLEQLVEQYEEEKQ